jgi:hypothetical protein
VDLCDFRNFMLPAWLAAGIVESLAQEYCGVRVDQNKELKELEAENDGQFAMLRKRQEA